MTEERLREIEVLNAKDQVDPIDIAELIAEDRALRAEVKRLQGFLTAFPGDSRSATPEPQCTCHTATPGPCPVHMEAT